MKRLLLCSGIISSALYLLTIDVVVPLLYPEYHNYRSQMVSELMAIGAPSRTLMYWMGLAYNPLVLVFGMTLLRAAGDRRMLRYTAFAMLAYGVVSSVGALVAPMDLRSAGLTAQTWLHIATTAVQGICMVGAMVLGAFAYGPKFRAYTLLTLVLALLAGAAAGAGAVATWGWLGAAERVGIYAWMFWIAALGWPLLVRPEPNSRSPRHAVAAGSWEASSDRSRADMQKARTPR